MKNLLTAIVLLLIVVSCDNQSESVEPEVELVTQELVDDLLQSDILVNYYATDLYIESTVELAYQGLSKVDSDLLREEVAIQMGNGDTGVEEIGRLLGFGENAFRSLIIEKSENLDQILLQFPKLTKLSNEDHELLEARLIENEAFNEQIEVSFIEKSSLIPSTETTATGDCVAAFFGCMITNTSSRLIEGIACTELTNLDYVFYCQIATMTAGVGDVFSCGADLSSCVNGRNK